MEAPPTYMPPQKGKSNVIIWVVIGGVLLCCVLPVGLLCGGGFWVFNKAKGFAGCAISFSDVRKGLLKYASEHNGKLPDADKWQDEIREDYRQSMTAKKQLGPIEQMSPEGDWGCKDSEGNWSGMAFNSNLSGKKLDEIQDKYQTVLLFETEHPLKNGHEPYKAKDFATSPKIFGANRGWLEISLEGDPMMIGRTGQGIPVHVDPNTSNNGFNFKVNANAGDSSK